MALADRLEALSDSLELPGDVINGDVKLSLVAGKQALVENHRGLLSFDSDQITLALKKGRLVLRGDGLYLSAMSAGRLLIRGRIRTVEWEG